MPNEEGIDSIEPLVMVVKNQVEGQIATQAGQVVKMLSEMYSDQRSETWAALVGVLFIKVGIYLMFNSLHLSYEGATEFFEKVRTIYYS